MSVLPFLRQALVQPMRMGALAPSSRTLARRIAEELSLNEDSVVVELGPGTGALTRELAAGLGDPGHLILLEQNLALAKILRRTYPNAHVIRDCVTNLGHHLNRLGYPEVDYVVSGLPWTLFSTKLQERGLEEVARAVKPGGAFVAFLYLHGMRFSNGSRFEARLGQHLGQISKSKPVWRNLPPARVLTWRRPLELPFPFQLAQLSPSSTYLH